MAAFDYIERLDAMSDPVEIQKAFADVLAGMGITNFALVEANQNPEAFQSGVIGDRMPHEWSTRYFEQNYVAADPVVAEAATRFDPFLWSEALGKHPATAKARLIFGEARELGLAEGLCIPIFGPGRYMALATLAGPELDLSPGARAAVHAMALYTHNRLMKLVRRRPRPRHRLTQREGECLRWAALGKSDWEIGEILSISENTAHWHIESAKRKLGVRTRLQAVMGAVAEGLIRV